MSWVFTAFLVQPKALSDLASQGALLPNERLRALGFMLKHFGVQGFPWTAKQTTTFWGVPYSEFFV